jgi:hypothetical protein
MPKNRSKSGDSPLTGAGNRKQVRAVVAMETLVEYAVETVTATPGINTTDLEAKLREGGAHMQRGQTGHAATLAVERGLIRRDPGPRNSKLHYPADYGQGALSVPE